MTTAESLKYIRYELRLNQTQLAERLGIPSSTISCYESGKRFPSYATVLKILNFAKKNKLKLQMEDIRPE